MINLNTAKAVGVEGQRLFSSALTKRPNKRLFAALHMSAFGTKQTFCSRSRMSAFGGKADIVAKLLTKDEARRIAANVSKLQRWRFTHPSTTQKMIMDNWLHNLPIVWMALIVFGLTALVTAAIYLAVTGLSVGKRAISFKAVSPGMLPPLSVLFALFVAFAASQVWSDNEKARLVVDREATALRSVVVLARAAFPGESETRLRGLIRSYVADAVAQEWRMMAHGAATANVIPYSLAEAFQLTLGLTPNSQGQQTAQLEITTELQNALDARRERIIISHSEVNWVKWFCLTLLAVCTLVGIAMVHSGDRLASAIALGLFGIGVAASFLMILAHDRPFTGEISVRPDPLLRVMPEPESGQQDTDH